eukprot:CAMPEP_0194207658 /NCGR_PEP_ID=MMETSP0156-20130528/6332_1 /TAXON_ID=33649 /ORGANISM="Thalassionema nitzschioides, Strain L26-B" /LENGTH=347 /DNA_ID=CAMNT_0038934469 /DNA_START=138 /DNA_END=1181 /DNA_ORIENTATION=+
MTKSAAKSTTTSTSSCKYYKIPDEEDVIAPPLMESMTMDRLGKNINELAVVQTTNMCCYFRKGCFRPSLHWVLNENVDQFQPKEHRLGSIIRGEYNQSDLDDPFHQTVGGWIHEESDFLQRCFVGDFPGSRETRFVQHAGIPPAALSQENAHECRIQFQPTSPFLTEEERRRDVVAIHEKEMTLPVGLCYYQPYMTSVKPEDGSVYGETRYICDACLFVPKFHVLNGNGQVRFVLRPDTCLGGACVRPRCGGRNGKCFRVPYLIRDPKTLEPLTTTTEPQKDNAAKSKSSSQVTFLWSGWANEVLLDRHAYHVAFPVDATPEEKVTLIGSAILVDVTLYEHSNNKND